MRGEKKKEMGVGRGEVWKRGQMVDLEMSLLIRIYFTSQETDSLDAGSISFTSFKQGFMF